MQSIRLNQLYYITHIDNVPSILKWGILSHDRVEKDAVEYTPIYDEEIIQKRQSMQAPDGRSLWSFANLYFQPRNAMLYRVVFFGKCTDKDDIVVLAVRPDILNSDDLFISTGNAASDYSDILPAKEGRKALPRIRRAVDKEWWKEEDRSKREMMAECLVPDSVPAEFIQAVYVGSRGAADEIRKTLQQCPAPVNLEVIPEPKMFFQPFREFVLTPQLTVVEGDMFFSRMHTLTISVNCVRVMGKGLASRAKYQFPDVYVEYQDVCRAGALKMGKPYLYKRESSSDQQLVDEPSTVSNANSETWFLLFATKRHWKERADIQGIAEGLEWLRDNYREEGIKSIALPALGCGLGRLEWREVGPLMCKSLSGLDIPVQIYLPAEKEIPDELLSKDFLLP